MCHKIAKVCTTMEQLNSIWQSEIISQMLLWQNGDFYDIRLVPLFTIFYVKVLLSNNILHSSTPLPYGISIFLSLIFNPNLYWIKWIRKKLPFEAKMCFQIKDFTSKSLWNSVSKSKKNIRDTALTLLECHVLLE